MVRVFFIVIAGPAEGQVPAIRVVRRKIASECASALTSRGQSLLTATARSRRKLVRPLLDSYGASCWSEGTRSGRRPGSDWATHRRIDVLRLTYDFPLLRLAIVAGGGWFGARTEHLVNARPANQRCFSFDLEGPTAKSPRGRFWADCITFIGVPHDGRYFAPFTPAR